MVNRRVFHFSRLLRVKLPSKRIAHTIVEAQTNSAGLSLQLSSSQKTFLKAEPISFDLKLSNDLASVYQAMGDDTKALRELCKISGEKFHHSERVERIVLQINKN